MVFKKNMTNNSNMSGVQEKFDYVGAGAGKI
jgi:hypothetical protein